MWFGAGTRCGRFGTSADWGPESPEGKEGEREGERYVETGSFDLEEFLIMIKLDDWFFWGKLGVWWVCVARCGIY